MVSNNQCYLSLRTIDRECYTEFGIFGSIASNAERFFELSRKLDDFVGDFLGLFRQRGAHALAQLRFKPNQFGGGNNKRQVVVDFMTHVRELPIEFLNLLRCQCDWIIWESHAGNDALTGPGNQAAFIEETSASSETLSLFLRTTKVSLDFLFRVIPASILRRIPVPSGQVHFHDLFKIGR